MFRKFFSMLAIIVSIVACSKNEDVLSGFEHTKEQSSGTDPVVPHTGETTLRSSSNTFSHTFTRGGESVEVELRAPNGFGFPVLEISNSNRSKDDIQYVIYSLSSSDGTWHEFDSSWIDISPGKTKRITFNPNEKDYTRGVLKLKLTHDGWSSSRDKVYVNVTFK